MSRKEKEFDRLREGSGEAQISKEEDEEYEQIRQRQRENRIRDFKKLMPVLAGATVGGFMTRQILLGIVGSAIAATIAVGGGILSFTFMFWLTKATYIPPGIHYTVIGHADPDNPNSPVNIEEVLVPTELVGAADYDAPNYPAMTNRGPTNLAESVEWDELTGKLTVKPNKGLISELEGITGHAGYHQLKDIVEIQSRKIRNLETHMQYLTEVKVKQRVEEKLQQLGVQMFSPEQSDKLMGDLEAELDKETRDLRVRTFGNRVKEEWHMEGETKEEKRDDRQQ